MLSFNKCYIYMKYEAFGFTILLKPDLIYLLISANNYIYPNNLKPDKI